jgi:ankyrin repeat protein
MSEFVKAAYEGNFDEVAHLFSINNNVIHEKDSEGDTSILKASRICNNADVITFLIESGANINDKDQIGQTPLIVSTQHGCKKLVEILISAGADIHERNNFGQSAIITAAQENQLEIAKFLIESGANVNIPDAEGETPYTYALQIHRGKKTELSDLFLNHITDDSGKGIKKKSVNRKKKSVKIKKKGKKGKKGKNKTNKQL